MSVKEGGLQTVHLESSLASHLPAGGPQQQRVEVRQVLLAQQDEGGQAAEGVAAVRLHAGRAAKPALVGLTAY